MKRLLFISLTLCALCLPLCAQTTSDKTRRDALKKEITRIDGRIAELGTKAALAEKSVVLTRRKIEVQKKLLAEDDRTISELKAEISSINSQADEIRGRISAIESACRQMILSVYRNRDARVWYMYLLSSDSLPQTFRRYSYLKTMSSDLSERKRELEEQSRLLSERKAELERKKTELSEVRDRRKAGLAGLSASEKREKDLVRSLNADRKAQQKKLSQRRSEMQALDKKIAAMVSVSAGRAASAGGAFASAKGQLPWPVDGVIVGKFGQHNHPVYKNVKLPFNNGVNISVDKGAKAYAVFEGEVRQVVVMPGYNQCVLVQHGSDYFTFYCRLSSVDVKTGQKVKAGTPVGTVDASGGSSEFHFQLWKGRQPQNPELWMAR